MPVRSETEGSRRARPSSETPCSAEGREERARRGGASRRRRGAFPRLLQKSEHDAFRQELPDHARAARAERRADGDFSLPRRRSRQKHVGDVGAGNQEDEDDRPEEDEKGRPNVSDDCVLERIDRDLAVGARILFLEAGGDPCDLRAGGGERDAGFQTGEDPQALALAVGGPRAKHERHPHSVPVAQNGGKSNSSA